MRLENWVGAAGAAFLLSSCTAPSLDDVLFSCAAQSDCPADFVCSTRRGACVRPESSEPGVTAERIRVGMTGPLTTGPAGLGAPMQEGIEAYFDFVNKNGGVDGRQIELVALDDGDDPTTARSNMESMSSGEGVLAYVGGVGTNTAGVMAEVANQSQRILFGPLSGDGALRQDPPDRYVFNVRASVQDEMTRGVGFVTTVRNPPVPAANVGVFVEAAGTDGVPTTFGQSGLNAVATSLRQFGGIEAADVPVGTYMRGTQNVESAVGVFLRWLGDGNRVRSADGSVVASIFLNAHARPAAAFVRELLDELFRIKRGTSPGLEYDLTPQEVGEILTVDEIVFVAFSASGPDELSDELESFGTYQTLAGDKRFCESVLITQVVPDFSSNASGLIQYRDHLTAFDPNLRPGFVSLEGYVVARLFVEGLLRNGPAIATEDLVNTFESMDDIDLGIGTTYAFSASQRQATDKIWATQLDDACRPEPFDLGEPGNPMPPPMETCEGGVCILTGTLTEDTRLTANQRWLLRGTVFVGNGTDLTTLTIDPGTTVLGEAETTGVLVIKRGSRIVADGTRDAPIVFTSSRNPGSRATGDWGGVIINGNAPINLQCETPPCEAFGEGGTGFYGGDDPDDNSGVLRYVRIEFAGKLLSPDNELNGLALQGVGRNTVLDYIQIHRGQDDGIEFFGGTVDFKHVMVTGADDDNLDWTEGWTGRGQFFVSQQIEGIGDNGIEADNKEDQRDNLPRSNPTLSNLTLIGSPASDASDYGMLIREGTGAYIANALVLGWNDACVDIDHPETWAHGVNGSTLTGTLVVEHSVFDCVTVTEEEAEDPITVRTFLETNAGNSFEPVMLGAPFDIASPDFKPSAGSPAMSGAVVPADTFFEQVTYRGAIDPANDWTVGWTTNVPN
ncbi:MAG: ABC transporter substrate-binding protein [Deltaproteobacteria bacterium]|jgi:hypothetical protein